MRAIACAIRDLEPSWAETLLATYLWPLLTILVAVLVPVFLFQRAAKSAVEEAARTAEVSRATTLEAVQLQIDKETGRAKADKRRDLAAEMLIELDLVANREITLARESDAHRLRLFAVRLDLELRRDEKAVSKYLNEIPLVCLEITYRGLQGVFAQEAMDAWATSVEAHVRAWARLELSEADFVDLVSEPQRNFIPQGPEMSIPMLLARLGEERHSPGP
jgi:hypothetical protein